MSESSLGSFRVRREDISAERLDGDVIAVNLSSGAYFSLSGSAADVWTLASSGAPNEVWLRVLDDAFGESVPKDHVEALLRSCVEHGLMEEVGAFGTETPELPDDYSRAGWIEPTLEVFTDLQDLILVDPIHDASDLGWPRVSTMDD